MFRLYLIYLLIPHTTLAREIKLYNHTSLCNKFRISSWCVSQFRNAKGNKNQQKKIYMKNKKNKKYYKGEMLGKFHLFGVRADYRRISKIKHMESKSKS